MENYLPIVTIKSELIPPFDLVVPAKWMAVEIHWPSGTIYRFEIPINRLTHRREGTGSCRSR